uniref:CSC1/OSCA1-like 7TM region domain-containing protein n=1 Tax=Leersia perrieri TaxID=77586 RepID=A0A0D9Y0X0_9ORYZ
MILSALATSVGINLGLTVLLAAVYTLLRRRPPYVAVYSPRRPYAPPEPWLPAAWRRTEEDVHAAAGLDGVVFVRIFVFSIRVFTAAAVMGVGVLMPVNFLGDQLRQIDFSDLPNKSVDLFSVSNVQDGSNKLWLHFSAAYTITGITCYLLYYEYKYLSGKRLEYFTTSKPLPQHFTVLVRAIPVTGDGSVSDAVDKFFKEYHSSTYLSHTVVHQTGKLRRLLNDSENICTKLANLKSVRHTSGDPPRRFLGIFGRNDIVGKYQKRLEDLEENVRMEQSDATRSRQEVAAAFVSFRSRYGAANAIYIRQSDNPTVWQTEHAPDPHDVYWPFFSTSFMERWISKFIVFVASILLILVFLLVSAFVQGLTYMEQLEQWLPFLKNILEIAVVSQLVTGYLPSVILHFVSSYVPSIMKLFSTMQGFISVSGIERSACNKMLRFTIWSVFFANVLTGSVLGQLEIFYDPKEIPKRLAVLVPAQLFNVYSPKYDTGGRFWPIVHNGTIFSLVLMHIIAIGVFTLKKLPLASSLLVPLPVLTLLFNEYCRNRFLPIFEAYSTESLIKKDREEQSKPEMAEFFSNLVTAYSDPAMKPIQRSLNSDDRTTPLLSSA